MSKRRNHDAAFKALVALKGERTVSELAAAYEVHPTMVHRGRRCCWKELRASSSVGVRRQPRLRLPRTWFATCMPRS